MQFAALVHGPGQPLDTGYARSNDLTASLHIVLAITGEPGKNRSFLKYKDADHRINYPAAPADRVWLAAGTRRMAAHHRGARFH